MNPWTISSHPSESVECPYGNGLSQKWTTSAAKNSRGWLSFRNCTYCNIGLFTDIFILGFEIYILTWIGTEFNFQMSSGPPASSAKLRTRKVFLTIKEQKWWKPVLWFNSYIFIAITMKITSLVITDVPKSPRTTNMWMCQINHQFSPTKSRCWFRYVGNIF